VSSWHIGFSIACPKRATQVTEFAKPLDIKHMSEWTDVPEPIHVHMEFDADSEVRIVPRPLVLQIKVNSGLFISMNDGHRDGLEQTGGGSGLVHLARGVICYVFP